MKDAILAMLVITLLISSCKTNGEPEAQATCIDRASFIADVTVPDHTNFSPGKSFKKTWRVKNTGTCTWDKNYSLVFAMNEQMGAPDSAPLKTTRPGKEINISVKLTAPNENGLYRADFQLVNANGVAMSIDNGKYLWVIISVRTITSWSDSGAGGCKKPCTGQ